MPLYTFIMEYRGGTYIRQLRAATPRAAARAWAKRLDHGVVYGFGKAGKEQLVRAMHDGIYDPVPITGVKHTWCCSTLVRHHSMGINFVQTEE